MELNITNGLYFNAYIEQKIDGVFVPFNEAFIDGELLFPLFDRRFIETRIQVHKTTKADYLNKMNFFFDASNIKKYNVLNLWFGLDAFCQVNMLALLAYLEQIDYSGTIYYQAIDDSSFQTLGMKVELVLGKFLFTYQQLRDGKPSLTEYDFINKGIHDYLYVKNKNNRFYCHIKENLEKITENQLIINILEDSSAFGLSDVYIKKMIDEVSGTNKRMV